jgi:hypothetical protein
MKNMPGWVKNPKFWIGACVVAAVVMFVWVM